MDRNYRSIAIDGPSGAGKSTLARLAAQALGFLYVDTGAIYRSVGLIALRAGLSPGDGDAVAALLPGIHLELCHGKDGLQRMYVNGEDVTGELRRPEVSSYASGVSAIPGVRAFLLDMQRDIAQKNDVVMDGRDIGTVVLPRADVKVFLSASPEERAARRFEELKARGDGSSYGEVLAQIELRDKNDSSRQVAPLKAAEDAVFLDTTGLPLEESLARLLRIIRGKLGL
ncbi:(d)CMP kinase [Papillibacter cinnamivorans]|uniref:Cytidylate kinase n=1 Tax=Papillibacter cinnamivorans DSM 12816 TaxID=1122930 RepID=A0A1W1YUR0_9FIRM|nr:(d)CMP kinase [Papillibacter cinnamivorans]SMC39940.1 cytidylate kinase [Papillibacter cinnamivorans DSM 12816]